MDAEESVKILAHPAQMLVKEVVEVIVVHEVVVLDIKEKMLLVEGTVGVEKTVQ